MLKALNEQPLPIYGHKTLGTPHQVQTSPTCPVESSVKESARDSPVIHGVKVVKKGSALPVILIVAGVIKHSDAPHHLVAPQRQEEHCLGVLVKRVAAGVELSADLVDERWHP